MYITLSSKNEASNSRFINKFQDTLTITPDSTVALASVTLNQETNDNRITVPAGQYIYLRFDGQNIIRLQPNATEQVTYTKQSFVDKMNTLIPSKKPYGSNIKFQMDGNDDIEIIFFTEPAYDYPIYFGTYIWGSNLRPQAYYGVRDTVGNINFGDFRDVLAANGTTTLSAPIQFNQQISLGLPAYTSADIPAGKSIYIDTAGISRAFNRAKVFDHFDDLSNTIYDSFGVCWGPQNATAPYESHLNRWTINWGVSEYDRSVLRYVKVPGAFRNAQADFKESLLLKGDYTTALFIWNHDLNDFDPAIAGTYLPGDVFQHYLQLPTLPNQTLPNDAKLYCPMYRQVSFSGLLYTYSCNMNPFPNDNDRLCNTLRIPHEAGSGFLQTKTDVGHTGNDFLEEIGYNNTGTIIQPAAKALGVHSGYGQDGVDQNLNNVTPFYIGGKNIAITRLVGESENYFNNLAFLTRRDSSDGAGNVQNTLERISLTRGKLTSLESAAFQIFCVVADDTAYNTATDTDDMTLIGGKDDSDNESVLFQIHLNQSQVYDVTVGSKINGEALQQLPLLDGGGNRINIQVGDRLGFVVAYTRGDTVLKVGCWKINAAYTSAVFFFAQANVAVGTFTGLNNAQTIGALESETYIGTTAGLGFSGGVGHFRWYGFPAATTQATLPADSAGIAFFDALGQQWVNNFQSNLNTFQPSTNQIFNSTDVKYAITGNRYQDNTDEAEVNNYCPLFYNDVSTADPNRLVNSLYPDLVDVYCVPNVMLPLATNFEGVDNLPGSTYTGNGGGITNNDLYESFLDIENEDAANRREIAPYTWYEPGEDDPWNEITAEGVATTELNQAVRVHIENLPHRTFNGTTGNLSKAIYEIQSDADKKVIDNTKTMTVSVPEKIRIPLNNAGNVVLNQFDVLITDQEDKELENIKDHTSVTLELL